MWAIQKKKVCVLIYFREIICSQLWNLMRFQPLTYIKIKHTYLFWCWPFGTTKNSNSVATFKNWHTLRVKLNSSMCSHFYHFVFFYPFSEAISHCLHRTTVAQARLLLKFGGRMGKFPFRLFRYEREREQSQSHTLHHIIPIRMKFQF